MNTAIKYIEYYNGILGFSFQFIFFSNLPNKKASLKKCHAMEITHDVFLFINSSNSVITTMIIMVTLATNKQYKMKQSQFSLWSI